MTSIIFNFCANQVAKHYEGFGEGAFGKPGIYGNNISSTSYYIKDPQTKLGRIKCIQDRINIVLSVIDVIGIIALFVIGFLGQNHFVNLSLSASSNWLLMGMSLTGVVFMLLANAKTSLFEKSKPQPK